MIANIFDKVSEYIGVDLVIANPIGFNVQMRLAQVVALLLSSCRVYVATLPIISDPVHGLNGIKGSIGEDYGLGDGGKQLQYDPYKAPDGRQIR
jgi:hypothetical protein